MAKTKRNSHERETNRNSKARLPEKQLDIEEMISARVTRPRNPKLDKSDIILSGIDIVRARVDIPYQSKPSVSKGEEFILMKVQGRFKMENEDGKTWSESFVREHLFSKRLAVVCYG